MKKILITGAASGLGRALAERYAQAGWWVILTDVQASLGQDAAREIAERYSVTTQFLKLDVTQDQDWLEVTAWINEHWQGIDAVINNAGVAGTGAIEDLSIADWQWLININVMGVARGCHYLVPYLKASKGQLINIASMAGLMHLGGMSAYNASKAAVVALSETLAVELHDDQVSVSVVCPSFFQTNLGVEMRTTEVGAKEQLKWLMARSSINAEDVAEIVYTQSEAGQFAILPHPNDRYLWLAKRWFPSFVRKKILAITKKMKGRMRSEGVNA